MMLVMIGASPAVVLPNEFCVRSLDGIDFCDEGAPEPTLGAERLRLCY